MTTGTETKGRLIPPDAHRRFSFEILRAAGATDEDAHVVADALLWAELHGRHTNGLARLANAADRLSRGLIRSPASMEWLEVAPAAHILDAADGFGHVASRKAGIRSVELARAQGVGLVGVRCSNHFGAAAYFCALAADEGCLSLVLTNAFPKVAAHGGARPVLGTNPIAFGCPTSGPGPILVDLSTSAISGAAVRSSAGEKARLPPGVALDAEGRLTEDPADIAKGCLLPAAGPKGFALALMVEVLAGALTGAAVGKEVGSLFKTWDRPVNVGHFFLAIDIARFIPTEDFLKRVGSLLTGIADAPRREGVEAVRFPGEIRARLAEEYSRTGVPAPPHVIGPLEGLARRHRVTPPW